MDATTAALQSQLSAQRRHVLGILDGLTGDQLGAAVLPSGWSCAGLVQHLAVDVEQFWFQAVVAGRSELVSDGDAWQLAPDTDPASALDRYRTESAAADEVIAATPLEQPPAWWPDFFGSFRLDDLRAVLLHVITETACHAGHLDAARELLDGRTWLVL